MIRQTVLGLQIEKTEEEFPLEFIRIAWSDPNHHP